MKKTLITLLVAFTLVSFTTPKKPHIISLSSTKSELFYNGYQAYGILEKGRFTMTDIRGNEYLHLDIVNGKPNNLVIIKCPSFVSPTCLSLAIVSCQNDLWCDLLCNHGQNPACILGWVIACNTGGLQ